MYTNEGTWNDISCSDTKNAFVCKKPKNDALTTPKPTETPTGYCPKGFHQFRGHCYKVFDDEVYWKDAVKNCKSIGQGYNLASVHSMKENAILAAMLYTSEKDGYNRVWIGGKSEGWGAQKWKWSDYTPFDVEYWGPNE